MLFMYRCDKNSTVYATLKITFKVGGHDDQGFLKQQSKKTFPWSNFCSTCVSITNKIDTCRVLIEQFQKLLTGREIKGIMWYNKKRAKKSNKNGTSMNFYPQVFPNLGNLECYTLLTLESFNRD